MRMAMEGIGIRGIRRRVHRRGDRIRRRRLKEFVSIKTATATGSAARAVRSCDTPASALLTGVAAAEGSNELYVLGGPDHRVYRLGFVEQ